jgi:predicted nucleic-acid-binding Zn-ribbon protein
MGLFDTEAISVEIHGHVLKCLICGHEEFHKRQAQLNTAAASFFGFDWANRSALCYVCAQCGHIHWFLPK